MPMISAMISRLPNLKEIRLPSRFEPSCLRFCKQPFSLCVLLSIGRIDYLKE